MSFPLKRIPQLTLGIVMTLAAAVPPAGAQTQPPAPMDMPMDMPMDAPGWSFMQDGVVYGLFNHQGGPRGGDEFRVPNWWMGMFSRPVQSSKLTVTTMLSLDPATLGKRGYREIFQVGEVVDGQPLIDHQHPHDFFMQLAASWRIPLNDKTNVTIAGGPAAEPALGPVAFMHRMSAAENPFAPLSHHTFDSTHISFGVVTAAVDRGPWLVEASAFNAREPDENRWDINLGALDSFAARVWFRPTAKWKFQISSGHLTQPEALEPGDITRTTMSGSWIEKDGADFTAVSVGYGRNAKDEGAQNSFFAEGTRRFSANAVYGRFEVHQAESGLLATGAVQDSEQLSTLLAFTLGGVRDVLTWRGIEGGLGAALTVYGVPADLTATHGNQPVSFQVFFRLRPPAGAMGRMWN